MADSSKTPTSTGGRPPSILAEAAKAPPFPTPRASSHYQISTRSSASSLNRKGICSTRLKPGLLSSRVSQKSADQQLSRRQAAALLSNRPLHSSVSGVLSKDLIDSSKAQSPTSERPKSVLDEVRTSSSSSTSHQSSQQFRFGPYASLHLSRRAIEGTLLRARLRLKRPESKPRNLDSTC